jgi:Tol biopolymer transport system component
VLSDGNRVVAEHWQQESNVYRISLVGRDNDPSRVLQSPGRDWDPAISPDGTTIAFVSDRGGASEIWLSSAGGTDAEPRTGLRGPEPRSPRWSPDGSAIVFEAYNGEDSDVWLLDIRGSEAERLTASTADDIGPTWSHDGKSIYFASKRSGQWQIWSVPARGGVARQVTRKGGRRAWPSADGRSIYLTREDAPGLWRVVLATGEYQFLSDEIEDGTSWTYLASDGLVYYERRRDGAPSVLARLEPTSGSFAEVTPLTTKPIGVRFSLSADGTSLYFARIDRTEIDLVVLGDRDSTLPEATASIPIAGAERRRG